jgi:hypothetical protein
MSLLTKSESTLIRNEIHEVEIHLHSINEYLKNYANQLWLECDKESSESKNAFEMLNHIRTKIRRNTNKLKKISEINRKLKKV